MRSVVDDFLKWWVYFDGEYRLQKVVLLDVFEENDASATMNIIDTIVLRDTMKNAEEDDRIHLSRAKLDNFYDNPQHESDDDEEHEELPEEVKYDLDHMDPEYIRRAQETKTNKKTDLKYTKQDDNGFAGLGPAFG